MSSFLLGSCPIARAGPLIHPCLHTVKRTFQQKSLPCTKLKFPRQRMGNFEPSLIWIPLPSQDPTCHSLPAAGTKNIPCLGSASPCASVGQSWGPHPDHGWAQAWSLKCCLRKQYPMGYLQLEASLCVSQPTGCQGVCQMAVLHLKETYISVFDQKFAASLISRSS
jgi:hypothetical protein